ncbi:MAG: sigma-70 family RNA polymerase sigma factor [Chloroflexi bacterium]|nr:sigma-70 family RNA polymerase sigma factor [Chloroflexota bacterium]MBI5291137.1 sigma-70 family RNA polymerase sigma factor [Chloroflexota bacterium]
MPLTSNDPAAEARLVQRAVSGDADAFARLYDSYADRVFRFVAIRVSDARLAEDVTAQAFLKAWENLDRYEWRDVPFGAWLFRIARNLVIDHYRTRKEQASLDEVVEQPAPAPDVDAQIDMGRMIAQLHAAMHTLTDDQRQVLVMKFMDGLTTEEIARHMGKQPGAIRALQMRGLQALAGVIDKPDD